MAKVLIRALNKNEACKNRQLYSQKGLECDLKIIAMTPVKVIEQRIKEALELGDKDDITLVRVVILGARDKKSWDFQGENDNLGTLFYRYHRAASVNLYVKEEHPGTPEEDLVDATKNAECLLKSPNLRFEFKFK